MTTSVLVPFGPGEPYRDRSWAWLEQRWRNMDVELIVESEPAHLTDAYFPKSDLVNRAAERATGDVLLIADADTAFEPAWVRGAVELIEGGAPWVLPRFYDALLPQSTAAVWASDPLGPMPEYEVDWRGDAISWAGLVVLPREALESTGGFPRAINGWGGDDVCLAAQFETLWGSHVRLEGAAMHLYHPRPFHDAQPPEFDAVMRRFLAAWGKPDEMRTLIAEAA